MNRGRLVTGILVEGHGREPRHLRHVERSADRRRRGRGPERPQPRHELGHPLAADLERVGLDEARPRARAAALGGEPLRQRHGADAATTRSTSPRAATRTRARRRTTSRSCRSTRCRRRSSRSTSTRSATRPTTCRPSTTDRARATPTRTTRSAATTARTRRSSCRAARCRSTHPDSATRTTSSSPRVGPDVHDRQRRATPAGATCRSLTATGGTLHERDRTSRAPRTATALHLVTGPGYYGGHPNPTRGNTTNTFNAPDPQSPVGRQSRRVRLPGTGGGRRDGNDPERSRRSRARRTASRSTRPRTSAAP